LCPKPRGDLELFLHAEDDLPLLIKVGLTHAQFETIHPFLDGNGRVGRLLITFLLCERGALHKPVLYLSHYFKQHRQSYYDHLQSVRETGDWEGWLRFFLRGVAEVSGQATDTARRILGLREQCRDRILQHFGGATGSGLKVLDRLFRQPIVSVNEVKRLTGTTYPAANQLVQRLVEQRVLREVTGRARNRRFRFDDYVALFTDEVMESPLAATENQED
jgi:Fic family protein